MLLSDIITLATDDETSLSSLLRKCLVLAHEIKNDRLKNWANQELNGYASSSQLPEYRICAIQAKGDFSGWAGSSIRNWTIPPVVLEERHRVFATEARLIEPVSAYEHILATAKGQLSISWPQNLVLYYQDKIPNSKDMNLVAAHQELTRGALVGLLNVVRTRTLNMALEIKSELGDNDEDLKLLTPEKAQKVEQTVTNIIYGGTNVIATGHSSVTSTINQQQVIAAGDWKHLADILRHSGLPESEVAELGKAIETDGKKKIGDTVSQWIKKTAPDVLAGGVKIGADVGQALLTEMLKQYFGL